MEEKGKSRNSMDSLLIQSNKINATLGNQDELLDVNEILVNAPSLFGTVRESKKKKKEDEKIAEDVVVQELYLVECNIMDDELIVVLQTLEEKLKNCVFKLSVRNEDYLWLIEISALYFFGMLSTYEETLKGSFRLKEKTQYLPYFKFFFAYLNANLSSFEIELNMLLNPFVNVNFFIYIFFLYRNSYGYEKKKFRKM